MSRAWIFPGQGSQYVGMGRDLFSTFAPARTVFDAADSVLGFAFSRLMFEGPEDELTDTVNAQPAILVHSIAALAALQETIGKRWSPPAYCAGHSLGEYSALVASGALDLADAVQLVRARGQAMKHAGERRPGAMAAILGLDDAKLMAICADAKAVQIANFNAPGQIVISGEKAALERAVESAKKAGAKRAIVLAVSIAAHSELMRPAIEEFRPAIEMTELQAPRVPVVGNVTALPLPDAAAIRSELLAQLTSSVEWVNSIEWMERQGITEFIEIGPKDVLAGLVKRIAKHASARSLGTAEQLNKFKQEVGT